LQERGKETAAVLSNYRKVLEMRQLRMETDCYAIVYATSSVESEPWWLLAADFTAFDLE